MPARCSSATLMTLLTLLPLVGGADVSVPVFDSGQRQTVLIELYTSEGCNSCPPADRWFSKLKTDSGLWTNFVPIAFHVDYWDYIGWKDRFAKPAWSARQRELVAEGGARTVYTPGVFVDGHAWLGWRGGSPGAGSNGRVGRLSVRIDGHDAVVRFDARDSDVSEPVVHIALLGMGLSSEVTAGENRGKTLHHDFVVLGTGSTPLSRGGGAFSGTVELPAPGETADRYALAAWVSTNGRAEPVQAVGGFLPATP